MEGGKNVSLCHYLADQKITSLWREKKCVLGHPIAQATSYCLLPHFDYGPPKISLKLAV